MPVRDIESEDAALVADIIRAAFAEIAVPLDPAPSALAVTADAIRAHLAAAGGGALYESCGCVLWERRGDALYLGRLAVLGAVRGSGIAAALLARAEAAARTAGLSRLQVLVRLPLEGNRRLFRRAGFIEGAQRAHEGYSNPTYVEAEKPLL